jgi:hypothetical protein
MMLNTFFFFFFQIFAHFLIVKQVNFLIMECKEYFKYFEYKSFISEIYVNIFHLSFLWYIQVSYPWKFCLTQGYEYLLCFLLDMSYELLHLDLWYILS